MRLLPQLAENVVLQVYLNYCKCEWYAKRLTDQELHVIAAALKPYCTWHKGTTQQLCREVCGGQGFHAANRIGIMKADGDVDATWEGDNTVLLQQVAAFLLKEFRRQFKSDKRFGGVLAYMQHQMSLEMRDMAGRGNVSSEHLRSAEFFSHAFEYREARLLRGLVNRLRRLTPSMGSFEAWNDCLPLVQQLARAHLERMAIERFIAMIQDPRHQAVAFASFTGVDPNVLPKDSDRLKPILSMLLSLYALTRINADLGWFMSVSYFSARKARAIQEEQFRVCKLLRPHAETLVESFGIPREFVDVPITADSLTSHFSRARVPGYP